MGSFYSRKYVEYWNILYLPWWFKEKDSIYLHQPLCNTTFDYPDQINGSMKFKYTTIRDWQKTFIESVARKETEILSSPIFPGITVSTSAESQTLLQEPLPSEKESYRSSINVKNILQVHFFEKKLKEGTDIDQLWLFIDDRKLHDGITDPIREFQRSKQEHQNECLWKVDDTITIAPIDCNTAKYPALQ